MPVSPAQRQREKIAEVLEPQAMTADIYARVSTMAQLRGCGIPRQVEVGKRWCEMAGVEVRNVITDARSAFCKGTVPTGTLKSIWKPEWLPASRRLPDHLRVGNLGKTLVKWLGDEEKAPDFLVVEDADRLSRQDLAGAEWLLSTLDALGVEVGVWYGSDEEEEYNWQAPKREYDDVKAKLEGNELSTMSTDSLLRLHRRWQELRELLTSPPYARYAREVNLDRLHDVEGCLRAYRAGEWDRSPTLLAMKSESMAKLAVERCRLRQELGFPGC